VARAVREGNRVTAVPRLLAMLCILAVFVPAASNPPLVRIKPRRVNPSA